MRLFTSIWLWATVRENKLVLDALNLLNSEFLSVTPKQLNHFDNKYQKKLIE
jgi:hypothetical protein